LRGSKKRKERGITSERLSPSHHSTPPTHRGPSDFHGDFFPLLQAEVAERDRFHTFRGVVFSRQFSLVFRQSHVEVEGVIPFVECNTNERVPALFKRQQPFMNVLKTHRKQEQVQQTFEITTPTRTCAF
jgi:hypothetical protein